MSTETFTATYKQPPHSTDCAI